MGHACSEDNNPLQPDLGGELAHKCLARLEYMGPNLERKITWICWPVGPYLLYSMQYYDIVSAYASIARSARVQVTQLSSLDPWTQRTSRAVHWSYTQLCRPSSTCYSPVVSPVLAKCLCCLISLHLKVQKS